ncbi:MAG: methyltransferase [Acidobacteriota bacterium]
MPGLDAIRYGVAVLAVISFPPAYLYWFVLHPFAGFWRRLGPRIALTIVIVAMVGVGYGLWTVRDAVLGPDLGTGPLLWIAAAVTYGTSAWVEIRCRRQLKFRVLAGVPELSADDPGRLLQQGIYSRVRHPRYLSVLLGLLAMTLFANHLGLWVLLAAALPTTWALVRIEERELRQRFGAEYERYAERVPRFLPRPGGRESAGGGVR